MEPEETERRITELEARLAAAEARIRSLEARNRSIGPPRQSGGAAPWPEKPRFLLKDGTG